MLLLVHFYLRILFKLFYLLFIIRYQFEKSDNDISINYMDWCIIKASLIDDKETYQYYQEIPISVQNVDDKSIKYFRNKLEVRNEYNMHHHILNKYLKSGEPFKG